MVFVMANIRPKIATNIALKFSLRIKETWILNWSGEILAWSAVCDLFLLINFVCSSFAMHIKRHLKTLVHLPGHYPRNPKNNLPNLIIYPNITTFATHHLNKRSLHQKKQPDLSKEEDMFTGRKFDKTDSYDLVSSFWPTLCTLFSK